MSTAGGGSGSGSSRSTSSIALDVAKQFNEAYRCCHNSTSAGSADVIKSLTAVHDVLLGKGKASTEGVLELVPEYAPEVLNPAFVAHPVAKVRQYVAQFCEDVVKRVPQMAASQPLLKAYQQLVEDKDKIVVMRTITGRSVGRSGWCG